MASNRSFSSQLKEGGGDSAQVSRTMRSAHDRNVVEGQQTTILLTLNGLWHSPSLFGRVVRFALIGRMIERTALYGARILVISFRKATNMNDACSGYHPPTPTATSKPWVQNTPTAHPNKTAERNNRENYFEHCTDAMRISN